MDELKSSVHGIHRYGPVVTVTFPSFESTGLVRHLFSTRRGGMSAGYLASMNLGFSRGDMAQTVYENYRRISFVSGIYPGDMVLSDQVHGEKILEVGPENRGEGLLKPKRMKDVDGFITNRREVCLTTFHADCPAIFLLDPVKKAIGLAHSGWKGTVLEIGRHMVERMHEAYGCRPSDILAGISPSIGPCCFEVGEDVSGIFEAMFQDHVDEVVLPSAKPEKRQVDLWKANQLILEEAGLLRENITVTDLCTKCQTEYFYSHRRMGNERGTMAAFLELI
ncbi:MAG: peptidoglycan editing factor PgeF [Firmicutes bacterium]|nr:peptidoglycan editing factor PgeF [Bacillota bacterium]